MPRICHSNLSPCRLLWRGSQQKSNCGLKVAQHHIPAGKDGLFCTEHQLVAIAVSSNRKMARQNEAGVKDLAGSTCKYDRNQHTAGCTPDIAAAHVLQLALASKFIAF
eukprot:1146678-Pelagomonas_calceolata.AAC.3